MKDSLLLKCLVASGALHAIAMTAFFVRPIHFNPNSIATLGKTPPTFLENEELVILKKDAVMEDAFKDFIVVSPQTPLPTNKIKQVALESYSTLDEPTALPTPAEQPLILPDLSRELATPNLPVKPLDLTVAGIAVEAKDSNLSLTHPAPSIQPMRPDMNPFESLVLQSFPDQQALAPESILDFEFLPSQEKFSAVVPPPSSQPPSHAIIASDVSLLSKQENLATPEVSLEQSPIASAIPKLQPSAPSARYSALPSLSSYGIPEYKSIEWNDAFDVDIKTLSREEGGYLFSLTFVPKIDLSQHCLKQNYYFLIDRSSSIERHRYQSFKRAVTRAVASLREGDNFNIIIFDSKIARLSEKMMPFNKKNQRLAEEFLERQPHGHYGPPVDLYSCLGKLIPYQVDEEEAHTAILISDGESSLKLDKQRSLINAWLQANRGKVTLYTAAVGQDNNLSSLDLLGTVSRGSLLYSDTHTGFPRKLAKLVLTLRSPVAKEMSLNILSNDPSSRLQLYPSSSRLPYLFSDHPYVLYGTAEKLSDFTLILEGKNKGQILSIKKEISFTKARPGNRLLSKEWSTQQAHLFYEQYLQEGKPVLLEQAQKLLSDEPARSRR
ncbi:MAG TPA: VWA domain-containing protein [Rhabdochlamydiaceae bacterium]